MRRIIISSFTLLMLISAAAQEDKSLTLQQVVETAINNNYLVKQSGLQVEVDEVSWKQAKANRYPDLFGNINHGISSGRNIDPSSNTYVNSNINFADYSLGSSVILFNGFLLNNTVKQNKLTLEASKLDYRQQKDNITLRVILAYLQILASEDLLEQSKNQAELSRSQVQRLEVLNREGAIPPAQLYDLKGLLANDEISIVDNQNALNAAKLNLSQLMNIPYNSELQVQRLSAEETQLLYEGTVDNIYLIAEEQLAIIKAAELRKQGAEKGVKAAKGNFYPQLFLAGSLNTVYSSSFKTQGDLLSTTNVITSDFVTVNGSSHNVISPQSRYQSSTIDYGTQFRNNYGTAVSVGLRIPIVNAFRARNNLSLAKINLKNATYLEENSKILLRQSIEEAWFNMNASFNKLQALDQQVKAFAESFRAAEIRFNSGASTSVDYLVAKTNLDRARINYISARYDYLLRTKILDYYQAKPLF